MNAATADPRPTCYTCPYFEALPRGASGHNQCRKEPPTLVRSQDRINVSVWPDPTMDENGRPEKDREPWCGEHPDFAAWLARQRGDRE